MISHNFIAVEESGGRAKASNLPPNARRRCSGQDLVLDCLLQQVSVLHELEDFLLALLLGQDLGEVLAEDLLALVAEQPP